MTVTPGGADEGNVWATPVFHNDYVHPVDLSAFISPVLVPHHVPPEDPPPYTEQLLEGHVTLMCGKTEDHKDDTIDQDANDTLLSVRDVSNVLDNSTRSTGCDHDHHSEACPPIIDETSRNGGVEPANTDETHGSLLARPPTLGDAGHFTDNPTQVIMPPVFRKPYRSSSIDNSDIFPDDTHREQLAARPLHFPPRLSPITSNSMPHTAPFLREEVAPPQSFPPRPLRLPPLLDNSALEMPNQHQKRNKRKRGHSWHGEAINILSGERFAVSPTVMTTVAE